MDERYKVLYVDDEQQNLITFKASFRRDYEIYTAQSGKDAISILRQQDIDLIISDHRMPGMTGVELFEEILPEFPEPIRMVVTGYSDITSVINAINKGKIYHFITKPWKAEELKLILDNALESYRLRKENKRLQEEKNELKLKAERQEKENILSQYESLKNQINPHFLFNCLNALALLVHDDPDTAEEFIKKLTKVYRYLLDFREAIVVSLEEELYFLNDYYFLQKIRFAENLALHIEVDQGMRHLKVPPLCLQTLVENAIKHNIISRSKPLNISIKYEKGEIVVKNNLQLRNEAVHSTGVGLNNLKKRYAFLTSRLPSFKASGNEYIARVPLLSEQEIEEIG